MKRARRQNRIIFVGSIASGILLGSSYGVLWYARAVIARAPLTIAYDPTFSENNSTELNRGLIDAVHTHGPAAVVANPTTYSPLISALSVRYTFPLHGVVHYKTVEPAAVLNHTAVALATGDLVPHDMLADESLATLPSLSVPTCLLTEAQVPQLLRLFLKDFSPQINERFDSVWASPDLCYYHDRAKSGCTLVASGTVPLFEDDIKLYDAVLQHYSSERTPKKCAVDIRFNGQVIVTRDGGL